MTKSIIPGNFLKNIFVLVAVTSVATTNGVPTVEEYMKLRGELLQTEDAMQLGGSMSLINSKEILVNNILMGFKNKEYSEGLDSNGRFFAASQHFFHAKKRIDESNVFKIIKEIPKGASLHMHEATVGDVHYIAETLTKEDNLYYCVENWDHLKFHFFRTPPTEKCNNGKDHWRTVSDLRKSASSEGWIDNWFLSSMSMDTPVPETAYPDTNTAWDMYEKKIDTILGLINYEEALKANYYQVMQQHYNDNVMYLEMRGLLVDGYTLDQEGLSAIEMLRLYKETTDKFVQDHPDFWGAKFIYAPHAFNEPSAIQEMINNATVMKSTFPDFFAGFDLVGQEDKRTPLLGYLPQLLDAAQKDIQFFFHSGETDWHGTKIDENLIDAVLLNTSRFAHGYALVRHPVVFDLAKQKGTAVEVCPISNQVLGLIKDLRNHPSTNYFKEGFPVVVSSDAAGMFNALPLSHDWYMAFMAIAGQRADLRFLKQLALNSITFSAMSAEEQETARLKWDAQWDQFLDKVIQQYSHMSDSPIANLVYY